MRNRSFLMLALLAAAVASGTALAGEQDGLGAMTPEMMEMMQKIGAPSGHHDHIARLAGDWKVQVKMRMVPEAEYSESEGKATNRMIMGGRFLQSEYEGTMMEIEFTGMGIVGYDNLLEKHIGIWFDSTGTMMMQFEGECAKEGMVTSTVSEYMDPMSGNMTKMKGQTTIVTDDKYTYESWNQGPDGKFFKSMEITYTRM